MRTYTTLLEALQAYRHEGWQTEIMPWGQSASRQWDDQLLSGTPRIAAAVLVVDQRGCGGIAAKQSVKAFYSLHRVRCTAFKSSPWSSGLQTTRANTSASKISRED
jgi:hypothetical protein